MGTRNLAFALIDGSSTISKLGVIDLGQHAARIGTERLIETLFGENSWMADYGHDVVVEMQPGGGGICRILSYVLQAFFTTLDRINKREPRHFRFMQAKQKFKMDPILFARRNPQTYAERKQLAVEMARNVLQTNDVKFSQFFEALSAKHKTDVADALVQGIQYLREK